MACHSSLLTIVLWCVCRGGWQHHRPLPRHGAPSQLSFRMRLCSHPSRSSPNRCMVTRLRDTAVAEWTALLRAHETHVCFTTRAVRCVGECAGATPHGGPHAAPGPWAQGLLPPHELWRTVASTRWLIVRGICLSRLSCLLLGTSSRTTTILAEHLMVSAGYLFVRHPARRLHSVCALPRKGRRVRPSCLRSTGRRRAASSAAVRVRPRVGHHQHAARSARALRLRQRRGAGVVRNMGCVLQQRRGSFTSTAGKGLWVLQQRSGSFTSTAGKGIVCVAAERWLQ